MNISSPFNDFYDAALAHGRDEHTFYLRRTQLLGIQGTPPVPPEMLKLIHELRLSDSSVTTAHHELHIGGFNVFFAGKIYRGERFTLRERTGYEHELTFSYTAEQRISLEAQLPVDVRKALEARREAAAKVDAKFDKPRFKKVPQDRGPIEAKLCAEFALRNVGAAIFPMLPDFRRFQHAPLALEPRLLDVQFGKAIVPWQAFQELSQYLAGLAAPENKPPVEIANIDRVRQRGFDMIYGFRKRPA